MSDKPISFVRVVLSVVVAAVFAAPSTSLAADENKPFRFYVEPFDFEALLTDVDTNSSKFEEYRDMDNGAVFRRFHLVGESGDRNRTFDFDVMNAGRAD